MEHEYRSQIIHEMQVLDEKLGKLFIAIIRDGEEQTSQGWRSGVASNAKRRRHH